MTTRVLDMQAKRPVLCYGLQRLRSFIISTSSGGRESLAQACFGIVIGWITHRTLRRSQTTGLSDISSVLGAVSGAAVTALFRRDTGEFGAYCIGLAGGFFSYLIVAVRKNAPDWLGSEPPGSPGTSLPLGGPPIPAPPPDS